MSLLYKALLKNNQQEAQNNVQVDAAQPQFKANSGTGDIGVGGNVQGQFQTQTQTPAFGATAQFAQEEKSATPVLMWIVISVLLLIVGLLAGYLVAIKQPERIPTHISTTQRASDVLATPVAESAVELTAENSDENSVNVGDASGANNSLNKSNEPPMLEVTVDDKGEVVSNVARSFAVTPNTNVVDEPQLNTASLNTASLNNTATNTDSDIQQEQEQGELVSAEVNDDVDLEDIPEQLKAQFQAALSATDDESNLASNEPVIMHNSSMADITELELSERAGIPDLIYQMHIFATDKTARWIKINGRVMTEGEEFMPGLTLVEIRQEFAVWESRYRRFKQEALVDFIND